MFPNTARALLHAEQCSSLQSEQRKNALSSSYYSMQSDKTFRRIESEQQER